MERSGEGKRGASAPRRLRISCPKDSADAEARMDETPLIEKFKKGNLQAFPVSFTAQVGATAAWSKKKRHGLQEAQILLERTNAGNVSAERAEAAPSEEEDDEAPLPPSFTPFGRSRSKERAKEDERVVDISKIPRRARSLGSRLSSLRRQLEPCSTGTSLQQAYQQRSPSPKRPAGRKNRPLKNFRVMGSPQISDQEVEVAEVLFDLSRSIRSFVESSKLMSREKSVRGLEDEDFDSSSSQAAGSPASEHLQKSTCPSSDEPKKKRQRASSKQEETSEMAAAGVGQVDVDELQIKNAASEYFSQKPYFTSSEVVTDLCYGDSQLHVVDNKNVNHLEQRSKELAKAKVMKKDLNNNVEHIFTQGDLASPGPSTCKAGQVSCKDGEHSKLLRRSCEDEPANGLWSKLDQGGLTTNPIPEAEGEDVMETDNKRLSLSGSSSNFLRNGGERISSIVIEKVSKGNVVSGCPATDVENEISTGRILASERNREHLKHLCGQGKGEQFDFKLLDATKENEKLFDQGARSACLPLCTLPLTPKNTVVSTGFPPLGFYGKEAPPWSTNAFFLGSSLGRKTSYPAIQPPAQHSVLRMKRCATHVYVAHYIQQRQQFLRQTFWPPAYHSGPGYNPSTLPANIQGKEQWSDNDAYLPSLQAGCVTLAESIGTRMLSSRASVTNLKSVNAVPSNSVNGLSVGAGAGTNLGHAMSWGTHGQFAHAMTQRNGFGSLYMPSNISPGQNASFFDKSLYQSNSSPLDLQSPAQQTSSPSHLQRRQQVPPSSHVGLSHPLLTQPHSHPQRKQQVQQEQQQHYSAIASQCHGAGSDGFSGGDPVYSKFNGKQSIRLHQQAQLQGQQAASPSDTLLSHRLSFGPDIKAMNLLMPKENDLLGMPCKDRASIGPVQSDFPTSAMTAKAHGAYGIDGGHDQQQQSLGAQQQQYYQRSYLKAPATLSTKCHHNKEQGFLVEIQSPIKHAGRSTDGSNIMECHLPMSVVTSTCGGPAPVVQATGSGETVFLLNGQQPHSHHIQNQAMAFVKPVSGANTTTGVFVENTSVKGNPPSPGHTVSSSLNVGKASPKSGISNGSNPSSSSPGQQVWSNLQSETNWKPHNSCASRTSSGTCIVPMSSSRNVSGSSGLNNTFNGEGIGTAIQGGVSRKTATVGGPNLPSMLNSGEKPSFRVQAQPQGQGQGQTMFPQQQSINLQQTRHQMYQQPHPSSDKHDQQFVHLSRAQPQIRPSQAQQLSPQVQIQSSTLQQSHPHKQLHSLPSNTTLSSGLSPSETLGTTLQGKTNTGTSPGQANNEK